MSYYSKSKIWINYLRIFKNTHSIEQNNREASFNLTRTPSRLSKCWIARGRAVDGN